MQLALQFLDPSAVFPSLGGTGRPRFAQTGNGILFPAIEFGRIQAVLTAPGTAGGFVHRSGGDHRFQPGRRRPALTAAIAPLARAVGQGVRSPPLQRCHAYAHLTRDNLHR